MKIALLITTLMISNIYANPLQDAIDKAPPYSTIKLSNGLYIGDIVIDKPLSIVGVDSAVIISGQSKGSVVTIRSSGVKLHNLTIRDSGKRMENIDSAIAMKRVERCSITHCRLKDVLYGIDADMIRESNITDNYITSYHQDISMRGDALKIWYSHHNNIERNHIELSRDVTLTYSNDNTIRDNYFSNSRFGIHISYSSGNVVDGNRFEFNSVGVLLMGAKDTNLTSNHILSSKGAAGIGVTILGASNLKVEDNLISYNAKGIYIDSKAHEEGMQRYITANMISHNKEAIHFHQAIKNNTITHNNIYGNIDDIIKDTKGGITNLNTIEYNYWDRYEGFDRDGDGIGDSTHRVYQYVDQLWHYNHKLKFFYATPILSLINFLTKLAPFIEPTLLLEDEKPLMEMSKKSQ
ncbi:Nitrous oxide reductase maturation protein NosD [hydrothermal vent metagenome]|uniref:Nitrous oxide reductase maturation protein NosD n=1 Tax=hydrothermal vent metagenome TaxID=652676 RepID=A0A1W1BBU8_9ZZZZ